MNTSVHEVADHESSFGGELFSVTDPETPVFNGLVAEFWAGTAAEPSAAEQGSAQGADEQHEKPEAGPHDDSPAWPLDENATFHGVSHR